MPARDELVLGKTQLPDPHQPHTGHTTPPLLPHEKVVRDDSGKTSPTCKEVRVDCELHPHNNN